MLQVGDFLPEIDLLDQDEKQVATRSLLGFYKVIYFYPKDNTPGCTQEACDFTEAVSIFNEIKVAVYGISPDSVGSHQKFIRSKNLKINLLSDQDNKVSRSFGAYGEKKMYGKSYQGILRTTFIVDPENKVIKVFEKVKVKGHVEAVKTEINQRITPI